MTTDNRTNEPTEAQVEAAARAIYDEWRSPDYFTWEQVVEGRNANPDRTFPHIVDKFRGQARAALVAAQGAAHLPSVEMIAEVLYDEFATRTDLSMVECERAACAVRALFGEVAGDE